MAEEQHQHAPVRTVEVCACGAIHTPDGWLSVGQLFARERLAKSTPEQRSQISKEGWAGRPRKARARRSKQNRQSAQLPRGRRIREEEHGQQNP
jgi:hypothetical protein